MVVRANKAKKTKARTKIKTGAARKASRAAASGKKKAAGKASAATKRVGRKPGAKGSAARKPVRRRSSAGKSGPSIAKGRIRRSARKTTAIASVGSEKPVHTRAREAKVAVTTARRIPKIRHKRAGRPAPRAPLRLRRAPAARRLAAPTKSGVPGVVIRGRMGLRYAEVLSPPALAFLAELHRKFDARRRELLAARAERQRQYDAGALPDFLPETASIRAAEWRISPAPRDLEDRRVEITGPVDRKMIINALNSGANVYMADFEDANSPTWANNVEGQINLKDRWDGKLTFRDPESGKQYAVGQDPAVLIVRPRGWHLLEEHLVIDGQPISGALFDFGLYFFHNARKTIAAGSGPYFYLPKLETHLEARLWNDVFVFAQEKLGLPLRVIRATVLIETLPAAFEMDEILYEMRDHIVGLNAGRWDYIFSFIKKLAKHPDFILPDRGQLVMDEAFLRAYALLLIKTCHRRGAFAMGGMAAQIPVKGDEAANEAAFAKVRADKEREARDGNDGTWVAHPALVPVARQVFDRLMPSPNQLDRRREDVSVTRDMLLEIHRGTKTEAGFRENIRVGVQYIEAWLRGSGAVPIYNLMEDTATAEISRAQIWQWIKYGAVLEGGIRATPEFFERALAEEMKRVEGEVGREAFTKGRFAEAIELFRSLSLAPEFVEFLTVPAYELIL